MIRTARFLFLFLLMTVCFSAPVAALAAQSEYRLGAGDVIRIEVYGEDDLQVETQLNDAGVITFPLLGQIMVKGYTPSQLRESITRSLFDGYLVDPRVSVSVVRYRSFYINGAVSRPGVFDFQPGLTVRKAISLAQGFADNSSRRDIYIISDWDSNQIPRRVSMSSFIMPGDIITVE